MGQAIKSTLTEKQRVELQAIVARPSERAGLVRRARVILLSAEGLKGREIARRLALSQVRVSVIRARLRSEGVAGLAERPKAGRKDHAVPQATIEQLVPLAGSPPPAGRSRRTTRLLGKEVSLSSGCVSDLLRRHGLKPHLVRTYKVRRDPEFVAKVQDVVGLYLNPPEHAVVRSVDEKTSIQALQRTQLPWPLRTGRAVRHTHDDKRHGVVDLYAALEVATGKVPHSIPDPPTGMDFLAFMKTVVRRYRRREWHVILDNSSTHGTPEVKAWLAANPLVHLHSTPTSASWLNQVEGFFGILAKPSLSVTDFPSKTALRQHLHASMQGWNKSPTPFVWTKPAEAILNSLRRMLKRISTAVR